MSKGVGTTSLYRATVRFWRNIREDANSFCWVWLGPKNKLGYGDVGHDTIFNAIGERKAHRVSWVFTNGPIPESKWILHRCDNPSCVNPSHLFLGNALMNYHDMKDKGRLRVRRADDSPTAKLSWFSIQVIRKMPLGGFSQRKIGLLFGISHTTVYAILKNKTWKEEHRAQDDYNDLKVLAVSTNQ